MMNHPEVGGGENPGSLKHGSEPVPGPETSGKTFHSITIAAGPSAGAGDNEVLERSLKELEHYYRHSCVGLRCLGIVHQMNTPLQVLSFQLDLLEQKARQELDLLNAATPPDDRLTNFNHYRQEKFRQLRGELDKLQILTGQLVLQGMHEEAQEKFPLDLNKVCQRELDLYLANPVFKHQTTREVHYAAGLPHIYAHFIDCSQSFRNLIDNALEAMEGMERRHLTVITAFQDQQVLVRIGDTGKGIPPENLPRIFEPFFTTRQGPGGQRAGLGLFMVRRLLAPYHAEIRVDSVPGETWVTVSIPVA
jgi:signal transduction histidine kinase